MYAWDTAVVAARGQMATALLQYLGCYYSFLAAYANGFSFFLGSSLIQTSLKFEHNNLENTSSEICEIFN